MKYSETPTQDQSFWHKFSKSYIPNLIFVGLMLYLSVILIRSIINNYAINQKIAQSRAEINQLEQNNKKLKQKIKYYQSDIFKEIEARAKLGYQKQGEKVIILPKTKKNQQDDSDIISLDINQKNPSPTPHYLEWWQIFFGK